ncbi:hypothetical protein DVS28_b0430 (plasmid) [Euzebya pacifica]|uniref:Uncharacterized protein n=1 Tax=Euzebya pacifica TaxID=1608957 RepID=A0A346Y6S5_9ACTN|nr:hypothetical protein [Euzebya pacifica]AXV10172.1 hypothetical protein DVS28_b0430 [Euzebya pacifica]
MDEEHAAANGEPDTRPVAERMADWQPPDPTPLPPDHRWTVALLLGLAMAAAVGAGIRTSRPAATEWCAEVVAVLDAGNGPHDTAGNLPGGWRSLPDGPVAEARAALRSASRRLLIDGPGSMWEPDFEEAARQVRAVCR